MEKIPGPDKIFDFLIFKQILSKGKCLKNNNKWVNIENKYGEVWKLRNNNKYGEVIYQWFTFL